MSIHRYPKGVGKICQNQRRKLFLSRGRNVRIAPSRSLRVWCVTRLSRDHRRRLSSCFLLRRNHRRRSSRTIKINTAPRRNAADPGSDRMNGVKNETHVRVEQTARGIWYCSGVDVYGENTVRIRVELEFTMAMIESILNEHNSGPEEEKQHTDLSTAGPPAAKPLKVRQ